jgi:hypothetical protein
MNSTARKPTLRAALNLSRNANSVLVGQNPMLIQDIRQPPLALWSRKEGYFLTIEVPGQVCDLFETQVMNIKVIEPIGRSETAISSRLRDLLEKGGHRLFICDTRGLTDADLIQKVSDADILLLSNRPLSRRVIEACPNLRLICVAFTGIDHVDQEACKARGIILHNAAGYAVHAVSELAFGLIVAVLRRMVSADATVRAGGDNREMTGHELFGKTLGVVGCGAIGLQVARLGNAFGCRVLGFERHLLRIDEVAIEQVELDELLSRSDIVSMHLALTAETRGFIGREQLARMKPSAERTRPGFVIHLISVLWFVGNRVAADPVNSARSSPRNPRAWR